ncbi:hypothetical protein IU421_14800 [Nocardia cyriacigeorgica]|uniref:hypothetical protein n=1 Tax=Nocardia cyriacigeorgica TaxID=135487 RepID=UPI001895C7D4|nr:hypothetical protein [Nocardia cyriacigeorgica]MBF6515539.1 hypothetical protein [Nocardia cyriacigeorgica]
MTIIAAMATDDQVYMACDTRTDYSGTGMYNDKGKIRALYTPDGEKILLAAAGNASILPTVLRAVKISDTPTPPTSKRQTNGPRRSPKRSPSHWPTPTRLSSARRTTTAHRSLVAC